MFGLCGAQRLQATYSGHYRLTDSERRLVSLYLCPFVPQPPATFDLVACVIAHTEKTGGDTKYPPLQRCFDKPALIEWALLQGWPLTPAGERAAEALDTTSDPSIETTARTVTRDSDSVGKKEGKPRGRKPPKKRDVSRDRNIWAARKKDGDKYEAIADRFDMSVGEAKRAYDRHRKRESRKK